MVPSATLLGTQHKGLELGRFIHSVISALTTYYDVYHYSGCEAAGHRIRVQPNTPLGVETI